MRNFFNFSGGKFPTPLDEIELFDKNNRCIAINVYEIMESGFDRYPYVTFHHNDKNYEREHQINLLYVKKDSNSH